MASPASIKKHPIHPMLIAFPIGLWTFALACDVLTAFGGRPAWAIVSRYSIAGGIAGAVVAAIPGLIDYFSIDESEMKRIATTHLFLNVAALIVFSFNLWIRFRLDGESHLPLILSFVGIGLVGIGGWLGGEMVYVKGMAVEAVEKQASKNSNERRLRRAS
jgi:uncharacterized membrane protein